MNNLNNIYKHLKTGNLYCLISTDVKSKQITNGEWIECVLYRSLKDNKLYTREKMDFYDKFELID